jgi:MIP family channel proteins
LFAEFIGTFTLIFAGAGSIMVNSGLTAIALAHGLAIFVMITAFGKISGGHFNPAISFGVFLTGKMNGTKLLWYWLAQLLGATVAAFLLLLLLGNIANVGTPALAATVSVPAGIALEAVMTFFLVAVVLNTAVFDSNALAPLAIGLTITMDILFGGPLTGAAMNPARAFGPALASGFWTNQLVYWVGPLLGAAVAAGVTLLLYRQRPKTAVSKN